MLQLTPDQQAAVDADADVLLVTAPPGSGKTEVLIHRSIERIASDVAGTFRVLALTFTNRAAAELRSRAESALGEAAWRLDAQTIHTWALEQLIAHGAAVGVHRDVSVYDNDTARLEILGAALRDEAFDLPTVQTQEDLRQLLSHVDEVRLATVAGTEPVRAASGVSMSGVNEVVDAYDAVLRARNGLDFVGMLHRVDQLITEDPWVLQLQGRSYAHLLVDEAQDLSAAQWALVDRLTSVIGNVFVVADDDQEVFTFAGADRQLLEDFATRHAATRLELSTNFRSARAIVDTAQRLRGHLRAGTGEPPTVNVETLADGHVELHSYQDEQAEAAGVRDIVDQLLTDGLDPGWLYEGESCTLRPRDICIIGRTRWTFDALVEALDGVVPYLLTTTDEDVFDSDVGKAAYFGLRVLSNPRDTHSADRLRELATRPRVAAASEGGRSISTTLDDLAPSWSASEELLAGLRDIEAVDTEGLGAALAALIPEPAGFAADGPNGGDPEVATVAEDAVLADRDRLRRHWETYELATQPARRSLPGFVRWLGARGRSRDVDPGVRLLTPHRAKGLEFRVVVVLGLNEGTFPYYRATSDEEIDQERRALYVSMTRASRLLVLTRPESRLTSYGNVRRDGPSRFLQEAGLRPSSRLRAPTSRRGEPVADPREEE